MGCSPHLPKHRPRAAGGASAGHDGVVTLRGEALGLAQLKLTAEHAGDVDGVTEVLNEMTIRRKLVPAKPAQLVASIWLLVRFC